MQNITTDRLSFRAWREDDFEAMAKYFSDSKAVHFLGGTKSAEEVWRLLAAYLGHFQLKGYSYMAIQERESHALVGSIGLWNSAPWPELELGYWLFPAYQGKGYAFEGARAAQDYAFFTLKRRTLVSYISAENKASICLAEKLGGTYEKDIPLLDFGMHRVYRYQNTTK